MPDPAPMKATATGSLALLCCVTALALAGSVSCTAADAEDGFTPLFDGKSLDGWEGNQDIWSVEDGAITGRTTADTRLPHNTFLVWKGGTVEDFELRLSYRIVNGNSGIQYRSRVAEQGAMGPIVAGYQADFEAGKTYSGILYEERGRGILAQRGQMTRVVPSENGRHRVEVIASVGKSEDIQSGIKSEDWNEYRIFAIGNRLTHIINGRVTVDVIDDDAARAAKSGVLALQVHQGPPMTVQVKDIRLRRIGSSGDNGPAEAAPSSASRNGRAHLLDFFQGTWVPVTGVRGGEPIARDWLSTVRVAIRGNEFQSRWRDGGWSGRFELGEGERDLDIETETGRSIPAIFEFTDGNLRLAYPENGADRPKNFEPADGVLVITYRKE